MYEITVMAQFTTSIAHWAIPTIPQLINIEETNIELLNVIMKMSHKFC